MSSYNARKTILPLFVLLALQFATFLSGAPGDSPLEDEAVGYAGRSQSILFERNLPQWSYSPLYSLWYLPFVAAMDPPEAIFIQNLLLRLAGMLAFWALLRRIVPAGAALAACVWWSILEVQIGIPVGVGVFACVLLLCAATALEWREGPRLLRAALVFWCLLGAGFARPELLPVLPIFFAGILALYRNRLRILASALKKEARRPGVLVASLLPSLVLVAWFSLRLAGWTTGPLNARFFVTVLCFYPGGDLAGITSFAEAIREHPAALIDYFLHNAADLPRSLALTLLLPSRRLVGWDLLYAILKWGTLIFSAAAAYRLWSDGGRRAQLTAWVTAHKEVFFLLLLGALAALPMAVLLSPQRRFLTSVAPFAGLLAAGIATAALLPKSSSRPVWRIFEAVLVGVLFVTAATGIRDNRRQSDRPNQRICRILEANRIPGGTIAGNTAPHYQSLVGLAKVGSAPSVGACLDNPSCFAVVVHDEIAGERPGRSVFDRLEREKWISYIDGPQKVYIRP